ncbi:TerB N-terminal domain-containing protein [Lysobacter sp. CCNWLW3]|uniref:tellurite resistance TerB family protein n=1 Tax=unclassified Lysobacter TaxID=2635362 RepID=UPI002FD1423F
MAKRSSGGGAIVWLVLGALVLILAVPMEVWIGIGVLGVLGWIGYLFIRFLVTQANEAKPPSPQTLDQHEPTLAELTAKRPTHATARAPAAPAIPAQSARPSPTTVPPPLPRARAQDADEFYTVPASTQTRPSSHPLPELPSGFGDGRWVPRGEHVRVAGVDLIGGMIYVGSRLEAPNGAIDPCLINGYLTVAKVGNYRQRQMGYWPSYSEANANERRAYLTWLAEGRSHPDCDIGYVFLFFYGLERRIIVDAHDPAAKADWPAITSELRRLLAIYGEKSNSFKRYAGELLSWIELGQASGQLYDQPIPEFPRTYELPPYVRLALGQASLARAPLLASLALAWLRLSPETQLRTAATRCPDEFERLFIQRYHEVMGAGLVLPKNRTKLKFSYQAASSGMRGANISLTFGDTPDVTALTAPIQKLAEIANQCTDELGAYSRLVGKDPDAAGGLEGLLLLPASLWPAATQARLRSLTDRMREGRLSLSLRALLDTLGAGKGPISRDRVRALARALEGAEIGLEPHVLAGAKAPGETDTVVLFAQPMMDALVGSGAHYQTAALTLQLASAMAQADGEFNEREIAHLRSEIEAWSHVTPAERRRLQAHLQWLTGSPPTLASMKKKLEPLPLSAREALAASMVALAQSDGFVSPEEVKFLEKVYKALGVEPKRVFSDVHAVGAGGAPVSTTQAEKQGFRLDTARIAALQEDTARVSELLSKIFVEEAVAAPPPVAAEPEPAPEAPTLLGLDDSHAALLRLLLSRPEWTRAELEDAAADLDLMLDGALEQINEAAFDAFDEPLCEGDDPVAVNTELLEKIEA